MDEALLDTDILSEYLKGRNATVARRIADYRAFHPELTISVMTVIEITKGLHKRQHSQALARFSIALGALRVITLDLPIAVLAGQIDSDLERSGQSIGRADPIIAATAILTNRTLVTGNVAHFDRVRSLGHHLRIENWRE